MPDTPARPRPASSVAPTPAAPVDGAVAPLDAVTFRWTAPPGVGAFDLRVAAAAAPDDVLVELTDLPSTEATLADALPAGDLLWWVRRSGGAWSAPARFRAGTPADVEVARRTEAEADARPRAAARPARRPARGLALLPEAPPEPVWPSATGEALEGARPLDWSAVPGFGAPARADAPTVPAEAPRPLGPLGGEIVDAAVVALRWSAVPGALGYEVELSPDPAFDRAVLALDVGPATEVALPGLVPASGHRLLWRVRARMPEGVAPWSRYGRFYPAGEGAVAAFRGALDAARLAARRRRDHLRLEREHELDLVPLHEREDGVTDGATFAVLVGMLMSGVVIALVSMVFGLLRF